MVDPSASGSPNSNPASVAALRLGMSQWIKDGTFDVPGMPEVIAEAMRLSQDPSTTVHQLQTLIEKDQAIAGRLIQIANSILFRRTRDVASIHEAVVRIGQNELKHTLFELFVETRLFRSKTWPELVKALWRHSLAVAAVGRRLAVYLDIDPDELFLAGLIHDVGKAALLGNLNENPQLAAGFDASQIEQAMQDIHPLAGGVAARKWAMPDPVIESILRHHQPDKAQHFPKLAKAVYAANRLVYHLDIGFEGYPRVASDRWRPLQAERLVIIAQPPLEDPIFRELAITPEVLEGLRRELPEILSEIGSGFSRPATQEEKNRRRPAGQDVYSARKTEPRPASRTGLWVGLALALAAAAALAYFLVGKG